MTDLTLLNKSEIIFVVNDLRAWHNNGIINSVLRKIKLMEDIWGIRPVLFVTDYNPSLSRVCNILEHNRLVDEQISLNKGARVFGVFDYFQHTPRSLPDPDGYDIEKEIDEQVFVAQNGRRATQIEYYKRSTNKLWLVKRLNEQGRSTHHIYYNDNGDMSMIQAVDPDNQERWLYEYYLTPDQQICVKADFQYDSSIKSTELRNVMTRLTVYDSSGQEILHCENNMELAAYCLDAITNDPEKLYFIVGEVGLLSSHLHRVKKANVFHSHVVHNVFLNNTYDLNSDPQDYFKGLCEYHGAFDGIVFLTEWERGDFIKKFGDRRNTFTIPHPYPYEIRHSDFEARDHRKAVLIGRFHAQKRIDKAIDIFRLVADQVPDARLEIYGAGPQVLIDEYTQKINALRLKDNVFIKNYTTDPLLVMREAALFMMTSIVEGYPLTLVESISNGCPVFSYDLKYGPSDIVIDGVTGCLFNLSDDVSFANKMAAYFKDVSLQERMSEAAYHDARRFSKDAFLRQWYSMMETMYKRRNKEIAQ